MAEQSETPRCVPLTITQSKWTVNPMSLSDPSPRQCSRCPRCRAALQPPGLWTSSYTCPVHGEVLPALPVVAPTNALLRSVAEQARVPLWVPWPLPTGWVVTGVRGVGDQRTGHRATVLACSGPAPMGGAGEILLIAEEPGIGFGAQFAGLEGTDPGVEMLNSAPTVKVPVAGHPTGLWMLDTAMDRAVYVGESQGVWLWLVLQPFDTGLMVINALSLCDARAMPADLDVLPIGALCPLLAATAPAA